MERFENETNTPIKNFEEHALALQNMIPRIVDDAIINLDNIDAWKDDEEMTRYIFEVEGMTFRLFMNYSGDGEALYSYATDGDDIWDVYIDYLPKETLERRIFHEVFEVIIKKLTGNEVQEAHEATVVMEQFLYGAR